MARIDAQLLLSENQAVTGTDANSSVIDLGSTGGFMHPLRQVRAHLPAASADPDAAAGCGERV